MPPAIEILRWSIVALYVLVLAAAAVSDVRSRSIPNWTVLVVAGLFLPWVFVGPNVSLLMSLGAALLMLLLTVPLFAFHLIGAGDSKLVSAVALFAGLTHLPQLIFLTALAGGVLAVVSLLSDPRRAVAMVQTRFKGNIGRGIPYGVAIALGGAVTVVSQVT